MNGLKTFFDSWYLNNRFYGKVDSWKLGYFSVMKYFGFMILMRSVNRLETDTWNCIFLEVKNPTSNSNCQQCIQSRLKAAGNFVSALIFKGNGKKNLLGYNKDISMILQYANCYFACLNMLLESLGILKKRSKIALQRPETQFKSLIEILIGFAFSLFFLWRKKEN